MSQITNITTSINGMTDNFKDEFFLSIPSIFHNDDPNNIFDNLLNSSEAIKK